jgi:hypothetical protein
MVRRLDGSVSYWGASPLTYRVPGVVAEVPARRLPSYVPARARSVRRKPVAADHPASMGALFVFHVDQDRHAGVVVVVADLLFEFVAEFVFLGDQRVRLVHLHVVDDDVVLQLSLLGD